MNEITRREFGLIGAAAALLPAAAFSDERSGSAFSADAWHQRLKRIVQINFTERDAERFEVEEWADYLAETRCECTFLSISNTVAFYPTALPDLPVSRWLKGRDLFGECAAAARKRGIRVVGRLSTDIARLELAATHPDWFRRNQDGSIGFKASGWFLSDGHDPSGSDEYAPTCQFSGYYSDFVPRLIDEVMARFGIDGVYINGWPNHSVPPCYCVACRPIGTPGSETYRLAYQQRAVDLWKRYSDAVTRHRADAIFCGNLGSSMKGGDLDHEKLMDHAVWMFADNQGRSHEYAPSWDASQQTRVSGALIGKRPAVVSTGAYEVLSQARWRTVSGNPHEVRSRLHQTLAAGGTIHLHWIGYHQGFHEDRRWQSVGREVLRWQAENHPHFVNVDSLANVALVVSPRTNRLYKAPPGTGGTESFQGAYRILNEARIPFDVVLDDNLSRDALAKYSVLVLPNVAVMSSAHAAVIRDFVAGGGSLLTSFETGLYDETGAERADFALGDLFDMRKTASRYGFGANAGPGQPQLPGANSMQRLGRAHPITAGFRDTHWIQGSAWRVPIAAPGDPILTHIPHHAMYPVEAVFGAVMQTTSPTVVVRERGAARLVHLSGDIEAGYWRCGAADLGDLVIAALRWLVRDQVPLRVEGPGLLETYGWRTSPGFAVHLVNHTNPNFRGGALRGIDPIGAQQVHLRLPSAQPIRRARLLRAGTNLAVTQSGAIVDFTIPQLTDYEVAALEV